MILFELLRFLGIRFLELRFLDAASKLRRRGCSPRNSVGPGATRRTIVPGTSRPDRAVAPPARQGPAFCAIPPRTAPPHRHTTSYAHPWFAPVATDGRPRMDIHRWEAAVGSSDSCFPMILFELRGPEMFFDCLPLRSANSVGPGAANRRTIGGSRQARRSSRDRATISGRPRGADLRAAAPPQTEGPAAFCSSTTFFVDSPATAQELVFAPANSFRSRRAPPQRTVV